MDVPCYIGKNPITEGAQEAAAAFVSEKHLQLKDFRRIATRYDRLARNYLASVCLAAALVWWV
jgi:transposase